MNKGNLKSLEWDDSCNNDLCGYKPNKHSHTLVLGKHIKKDCEKCGSEMKLDAHLYECEFGANHAQFRNIYICNNCTHEDSYVLYDGRPQEFTTVYLEAEKTAIALSLSQGM